MSSRAFLIGIVDDIRHPLLDGQIQCLARLIVDAIFAADGEDETPQPDHLSHLVLHDDAVNHAGRLGMLVSTRQAVPLLHFSVPDEHQCQVIALHGAVGKHRHMLFQEVDHLHGRSLAVLLHVVEHAILTEQSSAAVA